MSTKFQSYLVKSNLEGILNIYKPRGPSSFSTVVSVRKITGVRKAGHIGTLDPAAEGVLPICLNGSTKISQFLKHLEKEYHATMTLGIETDSQDSQGKVVNKKNASYITENNIKEIFKEFTGTILQIPPMFSAKKRNGIPLYKLARNGVTVRRAPIPVNIISINLVCKKENEIEFSVHCSAGTYIRTLCHDIGLRLGCGGCLKNLIRTRVGDFKVSNTMTLDKLKSIGRLELLKEQLIPSRDVLKFLPEVMVKEPYEEAVTNGKPLFKAYFETFPYEFKQGIEFRISCTDRTLLAVAEVLADHETFSKMAPEAIAFKLKRVFKRNN